MGDGAIPASASSAAPIASGTHPHSLLHLPSPILRSPALLNGAILDIPPLLNRGSGFSFSHVGREGPKSVPLCAKCAAPGRARRRLQDVVVTVKLSRRSTAPVVPSGLVPAAWSWIATSVRSSASSRSPRKAFTAFTTVSMIAWAVSNRP